MITAELLGDQEVVLRLKSLPDRVRDALKKAMTLAMLDLRAYVAQNKLSGQVLKVRTGTLRRSITQRVTETETSITGVVGTNVSYAAVHEYGFSGLVTVKEHLRRSKSGKESVVRSYARQMNMPERSFLRSALRDKTNEIQARLAKVLQETANGSN
jgi:phage gpG-like protein